jgi:thiol:disulfide interchange protein
MGRGLRTYFMGRVRIIIGLVLLCGAAVAARADSSSADRPHVHVALVFRKAHLYPDAGDHGGLYFKLEPGWHVYWRNPGDAGEPPHVKWTLPEGVASEPLQFAAPKRLPLGPLMDYGYEDEVVYPFKLEIAKSVKPGPIVLHAKVDWLVCSSSCIPGKADLEITQEIVAAAAASGPDDGPGAEIWKRLAVRLPDALPKGDRANFQPTKDGFRLALETGHRESSAAFFPEDENVLDNPAPQKFIATAQGFTLDLKKDANLAKTPAQLRGVIELSGGRAYEIVALPGSAQAGVNSATPSNSAAAGTKQAVAATSPVASSAPSGFTAANPTNAGAAESSSSPPSASTPAVSSVTSSSDGSAKKKTGLLEALGLAFVGGLLLNLMPCVFPVLFLKGLALVRSGNEERRALRLHGLVYTAGIVASFWALVGTLLVLKAAGSTIGWGFQFQSPVVLSLMAGLLFFLGLSLAGQFEIGLTLTSAGGSLAAKQGYAGSFFTGVLAVVVATPCTAPLMGAAIGYALSQSAVVSFAVFTALALGLAAPYVALTLQPAWARLLPKPGAWMDVLKQAVAVPIFATVIWLAWVLAQAYGAGLLAVLLASFLLLAIAGWFLGRGPGKGWATGTAVVIMLGTIVLNVFSAKTLVVPVFRADHVLTLNLALPPGSYWDSWSAEKVARYQADGQPVFVDFTASWCLSCQVNERVALTRPEVMEAFKSHNVMLLKADWTRHDEDITHALEGLGRSGVPTYVLYTPGQRDPELLPEVLTPGIVTDALANLPKAATQENAAASNR